MPVDFTKVRAMREQQLLTQQQAAERAGWKGPNAKVRWSDFEKAKYPDPQLSTIEAVCEALGCAITEILIPQDKRRRPSGSAGSKG